MTDIHIGADDLRGQVRDRYAAAARTVTSGSGSASCCDDGSCGAHGSGSCCGPTVLEVDETFGSALYTARDRDSLPVAALAAASAAGTPSPWPNSAEGSGCWTSGPVAASTCCCRLGGSARPGSPTAWT